MSYDNIFLRILKGVMDQTTKKPQAGGSKPCTVTNSMQTFIFFRREVTEKDLNYCYLKDKGRMKFLRKYDERLKTTVKHKKLNRHVYKRLIRLECYKIVKHILGEEKYSGFKMWW